MRLRRFNRVVVLAWSAAITEIAFGFDPLDPNDLAADNDGDGLSNGDEILTYLPLCIEMERV